VLSVERTSERSFKCSNIIKAKSFQLGDISMKINVLEKIIIYIFIGFLFHSLHYAPSLTFDVNERKEERKKELFFSDFPVFKCGN
jgi:hypothetical protein